MNEGDDLKSFGGTAPFGYRWHDGRLVINENEAPIRKLIYELFLKHRRKKTVAKILNDLGYRTRKDALFSDTTIGRLLRDSTAKGSREIGGRIFEVEAIVLPEIWEQVSGILGNEKPAKQTVQLFMGLAYCGCGGKMFVPSNSPKYVCVDCRHKIRADDLETIYYSQLNDLTGVEGLYEHWLSLSEKEKRIVIEQTCERIVVDRDTIRIEFGYSPHSSKTLADRQQDARGNETIENIAAEKLPMSITEPLVSEAEAARFLGVSKMTVLRKRNAGEIPFFRVGVRVLYSKEKHLIPYLERCENEN